MKNRKHRVTGVLALAVLLILGMIVPAGAGAADHCPGANPGAPSLPDGYSILLDNDTTEAYSQVDRNSTVLPAGTEVCVKGGTVGATGIVTADGVETLQDILGTGQDVSYYMTYTQEQVEPDMPLRPILECVSADTAYFGYLNQNDVTINVPIGDANKVTGAGDINEGQPTDFLPGRTDYVDMAGTLVPGNAAFSTPYSGSDIVWTLTGPDGMTRTATAGANSPVCPEPPVDYCDPTLRPAGMSIAEWLPEDFDTSTCFTVTPVLACGSFDATVTGPLPGYEMVFLRGTNETTSLDWETLPATPEEDAGGGSVDITVYLVGPESDYLVGSGLPNYWDDNGRTVTIDTDCEEEVVVDYCDPTLRPAGVSIADWLPADFDTSTCFTVTPALACGSFDATATGPYPGYEMVYLEGTDVTPTLEWETLPAMFAEDYNGGTVDITTYLVGPEKDYLVGSTLPNYWDGTGETITINTDCDQPVVPAACPPGTTPVPGSDPLVCIDTVTETVVEEVIVEVPGETIVEEVIVEVEVPVEVEVLPEVIEAEPEPEPDVVEEEETETVVEETEVLGVTATRAVPTGIDSGTGGYLPSSTPTAALLLLMFGGLALASGAAASLVRRRG